VASRLLSVRGHGGTGHGGQAEHGDLSETLAERALPAIVWSDDDGSAVIAPSAPLEADTIYGVTMTDAAVSRVLSLRLADLPVEVSA